MDDLLLHEQTKLHLTSLLVDPPHALLLTGVSGLGKLTVASQWASKLTPHVEVIQPDEKGTISIDSVRELYRRTRSKRADHQIVIIDHAEAMGTDAQNAFLKLLEEPRGGVTFVLTAPNPDTLLPTITSRTQSLQLHAIPDSQLMQWGKTIKPSVSAQELAQLLFVAQGRPATFKALLTEEGNFDQHRQVMQQAKELLGGTKYQRLTKINGLVKDRAALVATLEAMAQMTKLQISKNPESRWLKLADGLQDCLVRLSQNANPRAQLLRLFVLY